jgi:predicted secreted hydrolase
MHVRNLLLVIAALFSSDGWKRIEAPLETAFPRDHGAHLDVRTEWWYATGIVRSKDGARRFGWQLTLFRQGLDLDPHLDTVQTEPMLAPHHVFAGHLAIVDLQTGTLVHAERIRRRVPGLADASTVDLAARLDGWTLERRDDAAGSSVITASALDRDARLGIALELSPSKPLVLHGDHGLSVKGAQPGNASAYVSWTRLATRGTLTVAGETIAVEGEAWFDHEWGTTQLGAGVVGWDWFGLRLDDGSELMGYRLRRADGSTTPQSSGTLIEKDGKVRHLDASEIRMVPLETWTSPRTQAAWPSRWHIEVPKRRIDLTIVPEARDCEIDARASTGNVYWEGPVRVKGTSGGSGYAEMTGYAGSMEGRF